jgi:phosphoglycolate phosphatase-like HAD superfamily hydrolase
MRFIVELEGVIFDIAAGWFQAHRNAARDAGWSSLDAVTFWRLTRTKGREADFLPGARPIKLKEYHDRFAAAVESDAAITEYRMQPDAIDALQRLMREGPCTFVTLGSNLAARQKLLKPHPAIADLELLPLNPDPRKRPAELKALAANDRRTIVAASSDMLIRSADTAELFTVGVASGCCTPARLHQAGARTVLKTLGELSDAARSGAPQLVHLGLPPERL